MFEGSHEPITLPAVPVSCAGGVSVVAESIAASVEVFASVVGVSLVEASVVVAATSPLSALVEASVVVAATSPLSALVEASVADVSPTVDESLAASVPRASAFELSGAWLLSVEADPESDEGLTAFEPQPAKNPMSDSESSVQTLACAMR
jgi:hypothetical protein